MTDGLLGMAESKCAEQEPKPSARNPEPFSHANTSSRDRFWDILSAAQGLRATGIISMSMVVIDVFTSEFEAQAVCHRLDAEGIAARMNRQGRYHGFTGAIAVEVDAADEAMARGILGDTDTPADMDEYVAPGDKAYRHCPACQTANVDVAPLTEGRVWLTMLTFGIAALFMKRDCRCRKCGHAWRG